MDFFPQAPLSGLIDGLGGLKVGADGVDFGDGTVDAILVKRFCCAGLCPSPCHCGVGEGLGGGGGGGGVGGSGVGVVDVSGGDVGGARAGGGGGGAVGLDSGGFGCVLGVCGEGICVFGEGTYVGEGSCVFGEDFGVKFGGLVSGVVGVSGVFVGCVGGDGEDGGGVGGSGVGGEGGGGVGNNCGEGGFVGSGCIVGGGAGGGGLGGGGGVGGGAGGAGGGDDGGDGGRHGVGGLAEVVSSGEGCGCVGNGCIVGGCYGFVGGGDGNGGKGLGGFDKVDGSADGGVDITRVREIEIEKAIEGSKGIHIPPIRDFGFYPLLFGVKFGVYERVWQPLASVAITAGPATAIPDNLCLLIDAAKELICQAQGRFERVWPQTGRPTGRAVEGDPSDGRALGCSRAN